MATYKQILQRAKRYKVSELQKVATISRRTIYALFSGDCKNPSYETVQALEKATLTLDAQQAKAATAIRPTKKQHRATATRNQ